MIYILIPVHNRISETISCIESVSSSHDLLVVVVDDGSKDDYRQLSKSVDLPVVVLKGSGDLFWAGSINYGLRYILSIASNSDYVLLANNDVNFTDLAIDQLASTASFFPDTIVSSVSVSKSDMSTIVKSGTRYLSWFLNYTRHPYADRPLASIPSTYIPVDSLTARSVLISVTVFKHIGLFNAQLFPQYRADDELFLRCKSAGYSLIIDPKSVVCVDNMNSKTTPSTYFGKMSLYWLLFNKCSPFNLPSKILFGMSVPPLLSRPTYTLVAVLKSVTFVLLCKMRLLSRES